jgi:hypothetical protein
MTKPLEAVSGQLSAFSRLKVVTLAPGYFSRCRVWLKADR